MVDYKKIKKRAKEAQDISQIFEKYKIVHTIMKFYDKDDKDDDIDIVVTRKTFKKAIKIIKSLGFKDHRKLKRGHIAHLREPLKIQFTPNKNKEYIIHLHKTFSWNGVKYLNPKKVHKRHIKNKYGLLVPSKEDQFAIIVAHSIFENNCVYPLELDLFNQLKKEKLNKRIIYQTAREYNWEHCLSFFEKNKTTDLFKFKKVFMQGSLKLLKDMFSLHWRYIPREFISYFIVSYFWCYRLSLRKGEKVEE
jgi:hypothetical protein